MFRRLWAVLIERCEDLDGVDWQWQAADGALGKARTGDQVGPNPTDRGTGGVKRALQVEGHGRPLSAVVAAANVPDDQLLKATIEEMVLERPEPEPTGPSTWPSMPATTPRPAGRPRSTTTTLRTSPRGGRRIARRRPTRPIRRGAGSLFGFVGQLAHDVACQPGVPLDPPDLKPGSVVISSLRPELTSADRLRAALAPAPS
jgi:hypothetical protein